MQMSRQINQISRKIVGTVINGGQLGVRSTWTAGKVDGD